MLAHLVHCVMMLFIWVLIGGANFLPDVFARTQSEKVIVVSYLSAKSYCAPIKHGTEADMVAGSGSSVRHFDVSC